MTLRNLETLIQYYYFHGNIIIYIKFNKNLSSFVPGYNWKYCLSNQVLPWNAISENNANIIRYEQTLRKVSLHLWSQCLQSPFGKIGLVSGLQSFQSFT